MAFRSNAKAEIKIRAGFRSELSGEESRFLHAAHLDHSKDDSYTDVDRGILVTDIEHYAHHYLFKNSPGLIGLSKKENRRALKSLYQEILAYHPYEKSLVEITREFNEALERWHNFYAFEELDGEYFMESM